MVNLVNRFSKWITRSFSRRIMFILLMATSVIILSSTVIYYFGTTRLVRNEYTELNSQLLREVNQNLTRYYEQLNENTVKLYNNNDFISNLKNHRQDYITRAYNENVIKNVLYADDSIQYIYFYEPFSENLYSYSRTNMSYTHFPEIENENWYRQAVNRDNYFYISPTDTFKNYRNFGSVKDDHVFTVNRAYRNFIDGEFIGVISIAYDTSNLQKLTQSLSTDDGYLTILNEDFTLRQTQYPENKLPDQVKDKLKERTSDSGTYRYHVAGQARMMLWNYQDSLYLLKDIPLSDLTGHAFSLSVIILVTSLVIFLLAVAVSFYLSRSSTHQLNRLTAEVSKIGENNLSTSLDPATFGDDEIGRLAEAFSDMTDRINDLINQEYKLQVLNKNAELRALHAQINPHFINNVLQVIGGLGLSKGATEVYKMSASLAKMMRYTLKTPTDLLPLSEEINNMKDYLYIQEVLWENRLQVDVHIGQGLAQVMVPVFILQPLVDNAINHGFRTRSKGWVDINIDRSDGHLGITVTDNGEGIPAVDLQEIRASFDTDMTHDIDSHVGLRNIIYRMRLIYGPQAVLNIESEPQIGTTVYLSFPIMDKER